MADKAPPKEVDAMTCRACGQQERASEGYPCTTCGTFICLICSFRGVIQCAACRDKAAAEPQNPAN